jgi:hypothetical protein
MAKQKRQKDKAAPSEIEKTILFEVGQHGHQEVVNIANVIHYDGSLARCPKEQSHRMSLAKIGRASTLLDSSDNIHS